MKASMLASRSGGKPARESRLSVHMAALCPSNENAASCQECCQCLAQSQATGPIRSADLESLLAS